MDKYKYNKNLRLKISDAIKEMTEAERINFKKYIISKIEEIEKLNIK